MVKMLLLLTLLLTQALVPRPSVGFSSPGQLAGLELENEILPLARKPQAPSKITQGIPVLALIGKRDWPVGPGSGPHLENYSSHQVLASSHPVTSLYPRGPPVVLL